MSRRAVSARLVLAALLGAIACSRTTDVYIGSDTPGAREAVANDSEPEPEPEAGASAPPLSGGPPQAGASMPSAGAAAPPPDAGSAGGAGAPADAGTTNCASGTADCDGRAENGCEVQLGSDPLHCGACGVACTTADCSCRDGTRVLDCGAERADCDGDADNGCESELMSDAAHCGACDRACPNDAPGVATAECSAGSCVLTCAIPNLRGDCDGDPTNGCEADLFHDPENCSECGMQCSVCADGRCL